MQTNYDNLIPESLLLLNLRTIEEIGLVKIATMKKIIANGNIAITRIGNKIHISRLELIRYLEENTAVVSNEKKNHA